MVRTPQICGYWIVMGIFGDETCSILTHVGVKLLMVVHSREAKIYDLPSLPRSRD